MIDALKSAILSPSDPFAVAYLQLCQISYADPSQIPGLVSQVAPLGEGSWSVGWGPAADPDDANLAYVAVYTDAPSNLPVLCAVVIRGTDVDISDIWGLLKQAWEDLLVPWQCPVPWLIGNPARVADGTLDALDTILGLTSGNTLLQDYLIDFVSNPSNGGPLVIVTGHSLGGCLTTVVAPWLQTMFDANGLTTPIVPATFAAPTAGNAAFASYFQDTFSYGMRVFNSLDIVPMAWAQINDIPWVFDPCAIYAPDSVYIGVGVYDAALAATGASYAQPATNQVPLTGACLPTKDAGDWYEEADQQHLTATYMNLLGGSSIYDERTRRSPAVGLGRRRKIRLRRKATLARPHLERSLG